MFREGVNVISRIYKNIQLVFLLIICNSLFLLLLPGNLLANDHGVTFWNRMESVSGSQLLSNEGSHLTLFGPSWNLLDAKFGKGWDNTHESSFAYANSSELIEDIRQGTMEFWWKPDRAGADNNGLYEVSVFFSNGATNFPALDRYHMEFWYARHRHAYGEPASFFINFYKVEPDLSSDNKPVYHAIQMFNALHPYTGEWAAGGNVHIAFSWHNEPVILDQYIAALWVDGELKHGWTAPDQGTLEGWRTTNPGTAYRESARIGDSIFGYSMNEQLSGPMDNIVFYNYAKSDFSNRFFESPIASPVANAGLNQSIHAGQTVILDGDDSYDDITATENLTYDWSFITIPEGSVAILDTTAPMYPTFVADLPGTYDLSLAVTDEDGLVSRASQVSISSYNTAPNADAGIDIASYAGDMIVLDGSASGDPDGDSLYYSWILKEKPADSTTELSDWDTVTPYLIPDLVGSYEAELMVNDGLADSTPDTVSMITISAGDYAQQHTAAILNVVAALPEASVTTTGNQTALSKFLEQAIKQLQDDKIANAEEKLVMAIERTDGCALRGSPDTGGGGTGEIRKDYIMHCADQAVIYPQLMEALEAVQVSQQ